MNAWIRLLAAALLFAAWGALVLLGKADAHEYVFALGQALVGLGVYHATTNGSSTTDAQPAAGAAQPAGSAAPAEPALTAPVAAAPVPVVVPPAPVPNAAAPAAVQ